jgi:probable HAF family extracellular repeat protein
MYSITVLGTMGGNQSHGAALNNRGQVVGYAQNAAQGMDHPFVWDQHNGMQDLGSLGGTVGFANAINNPGQVVGASDTTGGGSTLHAFVWDRKNGMKDMNLPRFGPVGINDAGQIVGNNTYGTVLVYSPGIGTQYMGGLGGPLGTWAYAINNSGQVVGNSSTTSGDYHAFLWDPTTGILDLGILGGFENSTAVDVNDKGQVVGYLNGPGDTVSRAFIWDTKSGMQDLGALGVGFTIARAVNNKGQVVGYFSPQNWQTGAFIWDPIHGMKDLNTLTDHSVILEDAIDINDRGEIVAEGWTSNGYSALLLKPAQIK